MANGDGATALQGLNALIGGGGPGTMTEAGETAQKPPPREHEEETWRWLETLADESERVRREEARFDEFGQYLDLYYGKHWPQTLPSFRPPVVANELRQLILSEANDLTESQLRVYITKDPRKGGRDDAVERALRAIWAREQIDLELTFAGCWALIVGTGFMAVDWDTDLANGLGDVTVRAFDPRYVLPDPDAVDDRKWVYVIREHVLDIQEVRRLFPQSGWRIRPEDRWSVKDTRHAPQGLSSATYVGPLTPADAFVHGTVAGYKKARVRLLDCLIKDTREEEYVEEVRDGDGKPVLDESGQPTLRAERRLKWPHGRRLVGANGVILFDDENVNPNGDFGLLRVVLEPTLGRFWGSGFVQQTAELQLAADKGLSQVVENAIRLNNGVVISTTNTGLDWESFAGVPAQIVQINPGSEFKIQYPPPMPPDMIQFPFRLLDLQRRLLGFSDARAGMPSRGNVSPELTETEIAQAQSATRLRSRLLYYTVQRLAEMIFARMAAKYTTPRSIPAVEGEEFKPVEWTPLDEPEKYSVYVDPASFQVMSKTMLRRLAIALKKVGVIDNQAVLERLEWPDAPKVAKRMNEMALRAAYMKEAGKRARGGGK